MAGSLWRLFFGWLCFAVDVCRRVLVSVLRAARVVRVVRSRLARVHVSRAIMRGNKQARG